MRRIQTVRTYDKKEGMIYLNSYRIKIKEKEKVPYLMGQSKNTVIRTYEWDECTNILSQDGITYLYENDIAEVKIENRIITGIVTFLESMGSYGLVAGELVLPSYLLRNAHIIGSTHGKEEIYIDQITIDEIKNIQRENQAFAVGTMKMLPAEKNIEKDKGQRLNYEEVPFATFYTDGGCERNPGGMGGYGTVLVVDGKIVEELSGNEKNTTNNRMEMLAVIQALTFMDENKMTCAEIISDSKYVIDSKTKWLKGWINNGWENSSGKVKNRDLWERILELEKGKTIRYKWVKGHDGNRYNERCDQLATIEINKLIQKETLERQNTMR